MINSLISDNAVGSIGGGIVIGPQSSGSARVLLERVMVANNVFGIAADGTGSTGGINMTIADCVSSGNSMDGIIAVTPTGGAPIGVYVKNTKSANNTFGIPVWERYPSSDGMFARSELTYDAERDVYICPNGKLLRTSGTVHDSRVRNYLSQPQECRACTLKQRCTRAPFKKIARDINEDARNHARSLKGTPEFERSSNARKKVEIRFAHMKVQHGFERMRLRGLTGALDEFHLAAIVQNLKTTALRSLGPPPRGACATIG